MSHSIIPPSSAHIWGKPGGCTAWVLMNQFYPETEQSEAAAEGTAAHDIAEQMVHERAKTGNRLPWAKFEGYSAENGVPYDEAMFDGGELYASDIHAVMKKHAVFGGKALGIEQRLSAPSIHAESHGTADCFLYSPGAHTLYIWDYKFGRSQVDAFENYQCINYAQAVIEHLELDDQKLKIVITVVQPRVWRPGGPIDRWETTGAELRSFVNHLRYGAAKALGSNAEANTGDHCKHCPGRHACPAALKAGDSLFEASGQPMPVEPPVEVLGARLKEVRRAIRHLRALETGYEAQVEHALNSGEPVPGWELVNAKGRRKWKADDEEIIASFKMLGVDVAKTVAKSPAQVEKLGVDKAITMAYCYTPSTGLKLAESKTNKAKQVFKQ